jgi:hypothetical protein
MKSLFYLLLLAYTPTFTSPIPTVSSDIIAPPPPPNNIVSCPDVFAGKKRALSKVSIPKNGKDITVNTVNELFSYLPLPDKEMRKQGISSAPTSTRSEYETTIVRVKKAYLKYIKRESDNDYHIVISSTPTGGKYFNIECSALPKSKTFASYKALVRIRAKFESLIGGEYCSDNWKDMNSQPISVTGAFYFDIDHGIDAAGPACCKSHTCWELHPITDIKFIQ